MEHTEVLKHDCGPGDIRSVELETMSQEERLYPIVQRLTAIKELMDPFAGEELELSGDGRRGLSLLIGDIIDSLNAAASEIQDEFDGSERPIYPVAVDRDALNREYLKEIGAQAVRGKAQNGKGSASACGNASLRTNLAKTGGEVK